jgi:hypothetical protein
VKTAEKSVKIYKSNQRRWNPTKQNVNTGVKMKAAKEDKNTSDEYDFADAQDEME